MGRVLRVAVILVVLVAGLAFHMRNHAPLALDFYAFRIEVPVSWLGVGGLAIGSLLGALATLPGRWRLARQLKRRTRELALARSAAPAGALEDAPDSVPPPPV